MSHQILKNREKLKESYGPFAINEILDFVPHRPPFLFVDRILEVRPGRDAAGNFSEVGTLAKGLKTTNINEPFFQGHFPDLPVTPGVVLLETMAQVAIFSLYPFHPGSGAPCLHVNTGSLVQLVGIDSARFRKPVVPGDVLIISTEAVRHRQKLWGFKCKIEVEQTIVAECEMLASFTYAGEV